VETLIAGAGASMGLPVEVPPARPAEDSGRRNVMVIEKTLRSGAAVRSKGDVLVYGDVNAGAEIVADGNIVVLGSLRGLAHAGRGGDESALIISFDLRPTQIRIGRRIAFPPAQSRGRSTLPEVARICDGEIVLQDYRGRLSL
jgi:septum site-determining protein MinC